MKGGAEVIFQWRRRKVKTGTDGADCCSLRKLRIETSAERRSGRPRQLRQRETHSPTACACTMLTSVCEAEHRSRSSQAHITVEDRVSVCASTQSPTLTTATENPGF